MSPPTAPIPLFFARLSTACRFCFGKQRILCVCKLVMLMRLCVLQEERAPHFPSAVADSAKISRNAEEVQGQAPP